MSTELESKSGSERLSERGYLELIGKAAPGIALLAGLLYVLGLYSAYRMDSSLGVGTIEVSRERAVSLGIVNLILLLPTVVHWMNVREYRTELSVDKFWARMKSAFSVAIFPALIALMMTFLMTIVFEIKESTVLSLVIFVPISFIVVCTIGNHSFARRLVNGWPLFLVIFLPMQASVSGAWLPSEYGGHAGKSISIVLKDGSLYQGTHRVSDSKVIVITTKETNTAISRDEISTMHSKEN